jgi:hypothetical protein
MLRSKECRKYAAECRVMAKSAKDELQQSLYRRLADQWDHLAKERRKFFELKRKVNKSLCD